MYLAINFFSTRDRSRSSKKAIRYESIKKSFLPTLSDLTNICFGEENKGDLKASQLIHMCLYRIKVTSSKEKIFSMSGDFSDLDFY